MMIVIFYVTFIVYFGSGENMEKEVFENYLSILDIYLSIHLQELSIYLLYFYIYILEWDKHGDGVDNCLSLYQSFFFI